MPRDSQDACHTASSGEAGAELEVLLGKRAVLADQVAPSTITLVISVSDTMTTQDIRQFAAGRNPFFAAGPDSPPGPTGFAGGLAAAVDLIKNLGTGLATFLGAVLPFLHLLILALFGVPWLRRRFRFRQDPESSWQK